MPRAILELHKESARRHKCLVGLYMCALFEESSAKCDSFISSTLRQADYKNLWSTTRRAGASAARAIGILRDRLEGRLYQPQRKGEGLLRRQSQVGGAIGSQVRALNSAENFPATQRRLGSPYKEFQRYGGAHLDCQACGQILRIWL